MDAVVHDGIMSVPEVRGGLISVTNMSDGALSMSNANDGRLSLRTIYRERLIMIDDTGAMIVDSDGDLLTMYDYNLIKN